jgi:hypothetical protein
MTTHKTNKKAIKEVHQGGPAQKNQNAQLGGAEARNEPSGVLDDAQNPQSTNPRQTGTPGGKGKQDAPQNQKR